MQAEKLEYPVGNIGHARHIAAVFHNGDERKHDKHQRHKTKHPAHARDHAVNQQGGEQTFWQCAPHRASQRAECALKPALGVGA